MDAREYLEQVIKIDKVIENKLIELEQWQSIACSTTASMNNDAKVQSSGSQQKMADAVIEIVEIRDQINEIIKDKLAVKQDVISTIEQLESSYYDILHKRYVQGKDVYELCDIYGRTLTSIKRKLSKAMKQVQMILNEREKNDILHGSNTR